MKSKQEQYTPFPVLITNHPPSMAIIQINLNILNAEEIMHERTSNFTSFIADVVFNNKKIKKKIEKEVCRRLIKQLKEKVEPGLIEEGVKAELTYSIITKEEIVNIP
jgi:hypothetical protein